MTRVLDVTAITCMFLACAGPSYGESLVDNAVKVFHREVAHLCPAKHFEWMTASDLDEIKSYYLSQLSAREKIKMERAAPDLDHTLCGGAGLGCSNDAYIYAAYKLGKLRNFARMACKHGPTCRALYKCEP